MTTLRHAYSKRVRSGFETTGESMTKQSFKQECDMNHLLKRYQKTGVLDHANPNSPRYEDFSLMPDYQTSIQMVMDAQESFLDLPSSVRKKFNNDAAAFLDFVSDPANKDEMVKMGLLEAPKTPADPLVASPPADLPVKPAEPAPAPSPAPATPATPPGGAK